MSAATRARWVRTEGMPGETYTYSLGASGHGCVLPAELTTRHSGCVMSMWLGEPGADGARSVQLELLPAPHPLSALIQAWSSIPRAWAAAIATASGSQGGCPLPSDPHNATAHGSRLEA